VRVERYEINRTPRCRPLPRRCGVIRVWRMLAGADATCAFACERMTSPPFGLAGGQAGAAAVVTLTTPDGATRHLPSKGAFRRGRRDSVVHMNHPGIGWFGAVGDRDPLPSAATCSTAMSAPRPRSAITASPTRGVTAKRLHRRIWA